LLEFGSKLLSGAFADFWFPSLLKEQVFFQKAKCSLIAAGTMKKALLLTLYSDFIVVAAIIKAIMASTATIPSTSGAMVTPFSKVVWTLEIGLEISESERRRKLFQKTAIYKRGV
jgi:hypothetical protein